MSAPTSASDLGIFADIYGFPLDLFELFDYTGCCDVTPEYIVTHLEWPKGKASRVLAEGVALGFLYKNKKGEWMATPKAAAPWGGLDPGALRQLKRAGWRP